MTIVTTPSSTLFPDPQEFEAECLRLRLKGQSLRTIGLKVGRSYETVRLTLERLTERRAAENDQLLRGHIAKLIDEVDMVREACWEGWDRSLKDRVRTVTKSGSTPKGPTHEDSTTTEGQAGDASFLRAVLECNKRESALRGIEKPVQPIFQFMQTNVSLDILINQIEQTVIAESQSPVDGLLESLARPEVHP